MTLTFDLWPWKSIGFQILLRTKYVPSLVKIHWRMLILECSQGCYRRTDSSITISLRNFVGEGIITWASYEPVSLTWFTNICLGTVLFYTTEPNMLFIDTIDFSFTYIYDKPDCHQVDSCIQFGVLGFYSNNVVLQFWTIFSRIWLPF